MADHIVRICLEGRSWHATLLPDGTIIGRDETCDIVIDSRHVSRRHARIVATPDGKWSVEDLGSSNGTFVNGQRVESCSISVADVIEIGPASLSFSPLVEQATRLGTEKPNIIIEDFGTEVFYDKPRLEDCQRQPCPEQLEKAKQRLSGLDRTEAGHRELCRLLASEPTTAAAVFRESAPDAGAPEVVAYHFGSPPGMAASMRANSRCPSHLAFRVSHRLLEAVRRDRRPLMSKSIFSCDTKVTLSLIDEHTPRALICVPLGGNDHVTELLYVDVPINERSGASAEEMFAFVQAVGQLVCSENDLGPEAGS